MNKLPLNARAMILKMLCEGQSMRATARLAGVSFNTVAKLLEDAGAAGVKRSKTDFTYAVPKEGDLLIVSRPTRAVERFVALP
jgi:hypothetical protein